MRIAPTGLVGFCVFLLLGVLGGQDTDWDRSIDTGDTAMGKQHYAEAETAYREALAIAEKRWKKDARISGSLLKVAQSCNAQGKQEQAELLAKRSSVSMDEALSAHKPHNSSDEYEQINVSTALFEKVGDLFAQNQRYGDAESMYEKSFKRWNEYATRPWPTRPNNEDFFRFLIQEQANAPEKFVSAGMKLATVYQKESKSKDADAVYAQMARTINKFYQPNDPRLAQSLTTIATSEARLGDFAGSEPLFKQVIDVLEQSTYKDGPDMALALENYALVLKKTGHEDAAKPFLDRAGSIRAKSTAVPH